MEYLRIIFRLLLLTTISMAFGAMRPDASLSILSGEGFVAYLEVSQVFGQIENCFFQFQGDERVRIELNSSDIFKTKRNERVFPFARDLCGIKVSNVSATSAGNWTLEVESANGSVEKDSVSIQILPPQRKNFDTRVQLGVGKSLIKCSARSDHQMRQCKMVNVLNGATYRQCALNATIYPHSMFECFAAGWGHMEQIHERIFVDIANSSLVASSTQTDDGNATILGCDFRDKIVSCQAEMPNKKSELLITDGLFNGRYSTYKTITSKSKCNLEIPKPFQDQDIGLWRIINYDSPHPSGCLFYVGKSKKDVILEQLRKESKKETIQIYKSDENGEQINCISCAVPFIVYDCYLKSPNNSLYFPERASFERERLLGQCSFYNVAAVAGIWKCGARGRDYDKEVVQDIEVVMKSRFGETLTEVVKSKPTDTVQLMCASSFEEPISHCAFISPQGLVHLVGTRNSIKLKGRVQYFGRGISKGECGIKITDVSLDDFGQWKCQFSTFSEGLQSSFVMDLQESETTAAVSVGLGVGTAVIIILVVSVLVGTIFYRRKNSTACHNFASSNPLELPTRSALSS